MRIGLAIGLALIGSCFVGCESDSSSDTPAGDCRNAGQECGAGFACRGNDAGNYECIPDEDIGGSGGNSMNADAGSGAGGTGGSGTGGTGGTLGAGGTGGTGGVGGGAMNVVPVPRQTIAVFRSLPNWTDAAVDCETRGGTLVWILSPDENSQVLDLCDTSPQAVESQACSIGLRAPFERWENGLPVDYTNWDADTRDGSGNFTMMYNSSYRRDPGSAGEWDDAGPTNKPYICRFIGDGRYDDADNTAVIEPFDPCAGIICNSPPEPRCDGLIATTYAGDGVCNDGACNYASDNTDCGSNGEQCVSGNCVPLPAADELALFPSVGTWIQAAEDCVARQGFLVWIESAEVNRQVLELCDESPQAIESQACSIGLRSPFENWENGNPVDYTNWDADTRDGSGGFTMMYNSSYRRDPGSAGEWDDARPSNKPYICRFTGVGNTEGAVNVVELR